MNKLQNVLVIFRSDETEGEELFFSLPLAEPLEFRHLYFAVPHDLMPLVGEAMEKRSVLFVCLGNICRSPTAEAIFQQRIEKLGLNASCDSAGTSAYHVGNLADERSREFATRRDYKITSRSRQVEYPDDFRDFDYILAMDHSNYDNLLSLASESSTHGAEYRAKVKLITDYRKQLNAEGVPDPYYGGERGFDIVIDILEDSIDGFIEAEIQG